jgi:CheY-like chemotaxis protein
MVELLVVDDRPEMRRLIRRLLKAGDYLFHEASAGDEAVALAGTRPLSLIVMDCEMPRMGGEQALAALRISGHQTPVIMLSAHLNAALVRRLTALGATRCLDKLTLADRLEGAVREALEGR